MHLNIKKETVFFKKKKKKKGIDIRCKDNWVYKGVIILTMFKKTT